MGKQKTEDGRAWDRNRHTTDGRVSNPRENAKADAILRKNRGR